MHTRAWTVGYEGLTVDVLLGALAEAKIELLVDVRERPLSRKPGFSKAALGRSAGEAGIAYIPMGELGTPPAVRGAYKRDGDHVAFRREYVKHLRGQRTSIDRLVELIGQKRSALLCFERQESKCHRGILCEKLAAEGLTFVHLRPTPPPKPARSSGVRLSDFH